MRRSNQDKIVAQIYLRDWSMKAEILRKAQMYENTIMHRSANDCTANNVEMDNLDNNCNIDGLSANNIKLFASALNCNRSGIYLEKGTTTHSTATTTTSTPESATAVSNDKRYCDISADDSLKSKSKARRNKNNLKMRKYKDIFNNMIKPMIAIDKL